MKSTILLQFKATVKKYNLITRGDKIIIGFSGGPDSLALTYMLYELQREFQISLHIAHLDHMLRKDSWRDAEFVERVAEELGITYTISRTNVKDLEKKGSLEEIARNVRLEFLCKTAREQNAQKIALGHNFDDQAETVLMRILRGTGLYGLAAILPKRTIGGFEFIRPLIETPRKEIMKFLARKNIIPRHDPSNKQEIFFRNKIRNSLIPLLEKQYNRNIKKVLCYLAETAGQDYDYILKEAQLKEAKMKNKIVFPFFLKLHPSLQRVLFRLQYARIVGDVRRLTLVHIKELTDLAYNRPLNSIVDLPKGVSAIKKKRGIYFYLRK